MGVHVHIYYKEELTKINGGPERVPFRMELETGGLKDEECLFIVLILQLSVVPYFNYTLSLGISRIGSMISLFGSCRLMYDHCILK